MEVQRKPGVESLVVERSGLRGSRECEMESL